MRPAASASRLKALAIARDSSWTGWVASTLVCVPMQLPYDSHLAPQAFSPSPERTVHHVAPPWIEGSRFMRRSPNRMVPAGGKACVQCAQVRAPLSSSTIGGHTSSRFSKVEHRPNEYCLMSALHFDIRARGARKLGVEHSRCRILRSWVLTRFFLLNYSETHSRNTQCGVRASRCAPWRFTLAE